MSYFWNKVQGLNADIDRHREEEIKLQNKIRELESSTDNLSKMALPMYRTLLLTLQQSKADLVSKLGNKK